MISCVLSINVTNTVCNNNPIGLHASYKQRWGKADLISYYYNTSHLLQSIVVPTDLLHCVTREHTVTHRTLINDYYNNITAALQQASKDCVPKMPYKCLKAYWNDELNRLKEISIDMHKLWRTCGSPKQGVINTARIKAKLEYKAAIKTHATDFERANADKLNTCLSDKDYKQFWKCWNAKYKKRPNAPVVVANQSEPLNIANCFKDYFSTIYINSADDITAVDDYNNCCINNDCDKSSLPIIDIEAIELCINSLKRDKAAGCDGLVAEHILNSHPAIAVHLKLLFTMMLTHGYVPEDFGTGIIVPVIKDPRGDHSAVDNYRPITLSPIVTKVFELLLLHMYSDQMGSDDLQFGFKKNLGCSNAIFILQQTVQYFNDRSSNVYIASLDASKAFDRLNHYKLFATLYKKNLSLIFINIIINWYQKLSVVVKWQGAYSLPLTVHSGTKQGSIISSIIFNMYVDCMISNLKSSKYGCHLCQKYIGCIMYADDLLLLSASVIELQCMLEICADVGSQLSVKFNSSKSKCISIGPNKINNIADMTMNGNVIQWVDKLKYLGIWICAGKHFCVDLAETRRKFFSSVNAILSKCKYTNDIVKLQLLESHCLPIIMYATDCLNLKITQVKEMNSWWNSVYRKIFGYNKWESVKRLISSLNRLDVPHLINYRQLSFVKRMSSGTCSNYVFRSILTYFMYSGNFVSLVNKYNCNMWSVNKIKAMMHLSFEQILNS